MDDRIIRQPWIEAGEAARRLRVSRPTLYAYVSRGFIRSQPRPGASRERAYSSEDVERLRRRTEERRDPEKAAARALHWGVPILESAIAFIDGEKLYYRGRDVIGLAESRSIAEVASLIWTGQLDGTRAREEPSQVDDAYDDRRGLRLPFVSRAQSALAARSHSDSLAFDLRPASVAHTGERILRLLARTATLGRSAHTPIEQMLARTWRLNSHGADLLRRTLILCADHELNVSSFTARCVASAGSNPYAVVIAGLSALEGTKHGGAGARVESMLDSVRRARNLKSAVAERLRRGESIVGFGHPLYRGGDPRAVAILNVLRDRYGKSAELQFVLEFAAAASAATREKPNLDYALAALARVLRLPPGSPLTLFAIGRTIGWIGHAIEQYATGELIRPRAKYVGIMPTL